MSIRAQEALRFYRSVSEEAFGKGVHLEPQTDLERELDRYADSVHQILSSGLELDVSIHNYPTERLVEAGQKLLEEIAKSNLPEDRRKFAREQASATMEWYRATIHLLSHSYQKRI
jgi:hypothetical protein